jgi:hypothetical protein
MTGHLDGQDIGRLTRSGIAPLDSAAGLALFDGALDWGDPELVAARLDLAGLRKQGAVGDVPAVLRAMAGTVRRRAEAATAEASADHGGSDVRRRLAGASRGERDEALLDLVRSHAAIVMRHGTAEDIGPHTPFREAGFDSLTAVELRNRLNGAAGLRLPSTVIFRHPTPVQLAERLHAELFPQQDAASPDVLRDLDRLGAALSGVGDDEATRAAIAERLRTMLTEVGGAAPVGEAEAADAELELASDNEMFALIDKELGIE